MLNKTRRKGMSLRNWIGIIFVFLLIVFWGWQMVGAENLQTIVMNAGESKIITFDQVSKVHVVSPDIVQVVAVSQNELVVNAKKQGKTDIYIWDKSGTTHLNIEVKKSDKEVQKKIDDLVGKGKVKAYFDNNSLFLRGTVDSQEQIAEILRLSTVFSKKIVNLLKVKGEAEDNTQLIKNLKEIVNNKNVKVEIQEGKILLRGDVSSSDEKKEIVLRVRKYVSGKKSVIDLMKVSNKVFSKASHIQKIIGIKGVEVKLVYAGSIVDSTIPGEVDDNVNVDLEKKGSNFGIILSGKVETQEEKAEAEKIAKAFSSSVVNTLEVNDPYQVLIDAKVVEVNESGAKDLGIEWGYNNVSVDSDGNITYDATPHTGILRYMEDIRLGQYGDIKRYGPEESSRLNPFKTGNFNRWDPVMLSINALINKGKAKLLSNPKLVTVSGKKAILKVGGQIPVEVYGENNTVTIEWKDYGIILEVTPFVNSDGNISVEIHSEVSNLDYANASKSKGVPALRQKTADTKVFVHDKDTIVLSGLISQSYQRTEVKTPLLGDIPVLGKLFRHEKKEKKRNELMIFLTPRVVNYSKGQVKFNKTKPVISISPENVKIKKEAKKTELNQENEKFRKRLHYKIERIFKKL
jgi:pilus assembly protein CpaC